MWGVCACLGCTAAGTGPRGRGSINTSVDYLQDGNLEHFEWALVQVSEKIQIRFYKWLNKCQIPFSFLVIKANFLKANWHIQAFWNLLWYEKIFRKGICHKVWKYIFRKLKITNSSKSKYVHVTHQTPYWWKLRWKRKIPAHLRHFMTFVEN